MEEMAAYKVLDEFFYATLNENWESAYEKLTKADLKNVPLSEFLEWKKVVTSVYKLGGYGISFFRRYSDCEYAGIVYPVILQFSVSINEMNVQNAKVSEENTQKYVAFDGEEWKVCLGYRDLKSNIVKFKYLAQAIPKMDQEEVFMKAIEKIDLLTGIFSLKGFIEQAEREILRSKRYGNPLTMGVITFEAMDIQEREGEETGMDSCISWFSERLSKQMRRTDLIGRCREDSLVILFTETKVQDGKKALDKLLDQCETEEYSKFSRRVACVRVTREDMENTILGALEKTVLWGGAEQRGTLKRDSLGQETPEEKAEEVPILGKYKLADILGFNKNARNHF